MKPLRVYVDTSVIGASLDEIPPGRREIAMTFFSGVRNGSITWRPGANVRVVQAVNAVNLRLGYRMIEIVPPEEVLDYGEMGI